MKQIILSIGLMASLAGCTTQPTVSTKNYAIPDTIITNQPTYDFAFKFRYGVTAKNELDTFAGTYTKDLITTPAITVPFELSSTELAAIDQKITDLELFSQMPNTNTTHIFTSPCESYNLQTQHGTTKQELSWDNCDDVLTPPEQAFVDFIIPLIEAHPEYQALPPATGGYL